MAASPRRRARAARWGWRALGGALAVALGAGAALGEAVELTRSHGLSAFGDLKYGPDFGHFAYVNPDAPKGGRIRLPSDAGRQTFDHFNPYIFQGSPATGAGRLFDSLMTGSADEPDAMYGLVAESVSLPADRSFAIFHLRPEARFADGAPVTAADVVWSFETLREKGAPWVKFQLGPVASAEALDGLTVRYDFAPGAVKRDLPALVAGLPIFAAADFATREFDQPSLRPPLGSGPYALGEFKQGKEVTYRLRDDYWAADLPVNRGQNNFTEITIEYYVDRDVQLEAFKAGAFDFIEEFTSANWALKYDFPAVRDGLVKKETLPDGRPSGTQGWWINTRREKFADPRVRRALDFAYDFEQANRQLFYGIYDRTDSFFENSETLQAFGPPSPEERVLLEPLRAAIPDPMRAAVFGEAYSPPVNRGDGDARPNLLAARDLLAEAGWTIQDQQLKNAEGEVFTVELLHFAGGGFDKVVWPFINNLEVLGIDARLRKIDPAAMERRLKVFDFDMTVRRFVVGSTPGLSLRNFLHSESAETEGSQNLAGVREPAIDALLESIQQAESREALIAASRALDRVFRAGHYWVANWYKGGHNVAYWDRFGRPQDLGIAKPPYERGVLSTWWYDAEKSAAIDAARGR